MKLIHFLFGIKNSPDSYECLLGIKIDVSFLKHKKSDNEMKISNCTVADKLWRTFIYRFSSKTHLPESVSRRQNLLMSNPFRYLH